ncbi:MAG TPA: aminotransferase class III-fold pyridoxal phosphate-dependent enzyme [Thermoanaerobaculia bacterium]|nr:aminotransferase class III-fold pyridoxal phosphate-dependent enzyme [Thermoanaerobaculia bacterium]
MGRAGRTARRDRARKADADLPGATGGSEAVDLALQPAMLHTGRDVAAFIMEPVGLSLGVSVPELAFMEGVQRLCRRYGTLLVMDEVATGFGRTGKMLASEHFEIEPDIMCLGKRSAAATAGWGRPWSRPRWRGRRGTV